ncbi:MAG: hypothetical protein U0791_25975 [Gemmataceae bacterium]
MRQWLMRNAFGRRLRRTVFTPAELAAMARNPSYRAPSAMDLHDEAAEPLPENTLEAWAAKDIEYVDGEAVSCSLSGRAFISLGERFHSHPWHGVGSVRLVAVQPFMAELAACPQLARLHTLNLRGNRIGDSGAIALAASQHLVRLKHLNLSTNKLTEAGLAALRTAAWFRQLESVDLSGNPVAGKMSRAA